MGRKIRRVPMDFDWPLGATYIGFLCPYNGTKCPYCEGKGYSPEARRVSDDWYDTDRTGRQWCHNITQDEVDALLEKGRLIDLTHVFRRPEGWVPNGKPKPTVDEVNAWSRNPTRGGFGHDSINQMICVTARCKRLGIDRLCKKCEGEGHLYLTPEIKALAEAWERVEPPTGEGWQEWETVSEGSPTSPVFATPEELAKHLARGAGMSGGSYERALAFVKEGWAPSFMIVMPAK